MKGGVLGRFPGQADARAELVGIHISEHLVEPQAGIQRQLVGDLPLVLQIGAEQPAGFGAAILYREGRIDRVAAAVQRQDRGYVIYPGRLRARRKAEAKRMRVAETVRRVLRDAVGHALAIHVRSNAVEDEVAHRVGCKMKYAGPVEIGKLIVEPFGGLLVRQHVELVEFVLAFAELR